MPDDLRVEHLEGLFPNITVASLERWISGGTQEQYHARVCTAAALAAYTRTGSVLLADAVGALATIDGTTMAANDRVLLKDGAAGADNGIWVVDDLGDGSTQWQMIRASDFDEDVEVVAGVQVTIAEGTLNGDETFMLTTNDPIVVNTTALTFTQLPSLADLASTAAAHGADLIGLQDPGLLLTATTVSTALYELARGGGVQQIPMRTVRGASTADEPSLVGAANPHDGVTYVDGDRMLLKDQTTGSQDGIYVWSGVGVTDTLTRDTDWNSNVSVKTGLVVAVSEGTLNLNTFWHVTANGAYVVGTTDPAFAEIWTATRGLLSTGAASGVITDAAANFTATTIEGALAEIMGLLEAQNDTLYVGKHGNDANHGRSIEEAFLTIGTAITAASALSPAADNEIAVVVTDSGIYAENLSVPSYVHLKAPMAQISDGAGGLALATLASVDIGILTASAGGCMAVAAGTAIARIKLLRIASALTGVDCNGGFLDLTVDRCECENGDPFMVNGNPATAGMNLVCNSINITGTASALVSLTGPLNAVVGRIDDAGAGTAFETAASANAIIHAQVGDIDCNTRWTLGAASELHLSCAHMTAGVETGTVTRLSIAGEMYESGGPTNLAVAAIADGYTLIRSGTTVTGQNLALTTTPGGASYVGIWDTGGIITAITVEDALQEIQTALDVEEAALQTYITLLASIANAEGASQIGVEDSAGDFTGATVEACLAEIMSQLAATGHASHGAHLVGIEDTGVIIAATTVEGALQENRTALDVEEAALVTFIALLASTSPGEGASEIGINDTGGIITALEVEGALQEIQTALDVEEAALVTYIALLASTTIAEGAAQIGLYDAGDIITATNVQDALQENRVALDVEEAALQTYIALLASMTIGEGASQVGIDDAGGILAANNVETALQEIQTALDVDEAALATLITDLASTANTEGASLIGIEDVADDITATTVEGALAENRAALDVEEAALQTFIALLASTANAEGASQVSIEDSGSLITGTTVETALAEVVLQKREVIITTTELTAAAGFQHFTIGAALPATAIVLGHQINVTALYDDGAACTSDVDIGINGGDTDCVEDGLDTTLATGATGIQSGTLGIRHLGNMGSSTLGCTVNSNVNVNTLTVGSVTFTVYFIAAT